MSKKEEILDTLKALKPELAARFKVQEIGLFGSFVRGEQNAESDIDLVVDLNNDADLFDLIRLGNFLEERLHRKVDVGTRRSLRPEIREQVMRELATV
jgi:predicted nucleotidyltransferase